MTELTFTLPFPPSINSMYSQGLIGGKKNLDEPLIEVVRGLTKNPDTTTVDELVKLCEEHRMALRDRIKAAFGSPRASMFLSDAGKKYRDIARQALQTQRVPKNSLAGKLKVVAIAFPPDARVRDLDNLWKSALDVLKHNEIITDDGHIDDLQIRRGAKVEGGAFAVTVSELAGAFESRQQGFDLDQGRAPANAPPPF